MLSHGLVVGSTLISSFLMIRIGTHRVSGIQMETADDQT